MTAEAGYSASTDDLAAREEALHPMGDAIDAALDRLPGDPGAIFEVDILAAIRTARQTDPARYVRIRAKAKANGASITELDKLTQAGKDDGKAEMFPEVALWPDPVNGAALLAELCAVLREHVIADDVTITAAALWIMHTWLMDVFTVSPLAHITAPEKRCGKTILLTAMLRLVFRPLPASNISPAALFRSVEAFAPTLLIDEVDAFLRDNEEARGLINCGLYRETAFVIRTTGDDHTPTNFSVWAAKALCGIGKLADTIEDRSIPLRMRRKVDGEHAASIRHSDPALWERLRQRIARWVQDHRGVIAVARRPTPALGLNDRAQDCWEPLLSIADAIGEEWPGRARAAAVALHGVEEETPSIGVELLRDIKAVFDDRHASRIASRDLLAALIADDEAPWATWNRGKPLTVRQLAARIGDFAVSTKTTRLPNRERLKGYLLADFADAFARYLFSEGGVSKRDTVPTAPLCGLQGMTNRADASTVTHEKAPQALADNDCHASRLKTPLPEKGDGHMERITV